MGDHIKIAFRSKADHPRRYTYILFASVTLISNRWPRYTINTNLTWTFWKFHCIPKVNFLGQSFQKLQHYRETDRQTNATENIATPRLRAIIISVRFIQLLHVRCIALITKRRLKLRQLTDIGDMLPLIDNQYLISVCEPRYIFEPYEEVWYRPTATVMQQL